MKGMCSCRMIRLIYLIFSSVKGKNTGMIVKVTTKCLWILHFISTWSSMKQWDRYRAHIFFAFLTKSKDTIIFTGINLHKRSYEFRLTTIFSYSCIHFSSAFIQIASTYHQECIIYHSCRYHKYSGQDGESLLTYWCNRKN